MKDHLESSIFGDHDDHPDDHPEAHLDGDRVIEAPASGAVPASSKPSSRPT